MHHVTQNRYYVICIYMLPVNNNILDILGGGQPFDYFINVFVFVLWIRPKLTHPPLVPQICVSKSGQHWFRSWLVAYSAPNHYLNQCWVIVNWTLMNKLQWNFNQNTKFFIKNMHMNISSAKWWPFSPGRNELIKLRFWSHEEISVVS